MKACGNGRAVPLPVGAALGGMYGFIWTFLASAILGWMIRKQWLQMESVGYGCMIILLTASMLAAGISYRKVKIRRFLSCMSGGAGYFLLLLAATVLFFGGQYSGFGVTCLLVLGGSLASAFLGMELGKGSRKGRKIRVP